MRVCNIHMACRYLYTTILYARPLIIQTLSFIHTRKRCIYLIFRQAEINGIPFINVPDYFYVRF